MFPTRSSCPFHFANVYNGAVKEVFLDFFEVEHITGKYLVDTIIKAIATWELGLENLRGQCFDGASSMSGAKSGCSAIIKQHAPLAMYTYCASHRLNLSIVSACKLQEH